MSNQFNTGESKHKAQMSIVFEAQMSYRFTGKKAQTSCAHTIRSILIIDVICSIGCLKFQRKQFLGMTSQPLSDKRIFLKELSILLPFYSSVRF